MSPVVLMRACAPARHQGGPFGPGRPQGRGKIERFFRTVNGELTVAIAVGDGQPGRQAGAAWPR
jgi:putative transposase